MNDKELLVAAARAAGVEYEPRYVEPDGVKMRGLMQPSGIANIPPKWWNPLTDDGDALRLAVELMLTITMRHHECEAFDEDGQFLTSESLHCPPDARQELVRRAIVRAAAALDSGHNAVMSRPAGVGLDRELGLRAGKDDDGLTNPSRARPLCHLAGT